MIKLKCLLWVAFFLVAACSSDDESLSESSALKSSSNLAVAENASLDKGRSETSDKSRDHHPLPSEASDDELVIDDKPDLNYESNSTVVDNTDFNNRNAVASDAIEEPQLVSPEVATEELDSIENVDPKSVTQLKLDNDPESTTNFLPIALIILSLTTLVSIIISFWLYRWRRLLLGELKALSPEEFGSHAKSLVDIISNLQEQVVYSLNKVNQEIVDLTIKSETMTETYMSLHHSIDAKDQEITRLKSGYDSQIYKKFIKRFLRVDQVIEDVMLESGPAIDPNLEQIQATLEDALDECGVERFSPEIGAQYKDTFGVADRPKLQETNDAEKHGVVSRVVEPGYRISGNEGFELLVPAKVEIYNFIEPGE